MKEIGRPSIEKANLIACATGNKKAIDPMILEVGKLTSVAEYFIIASGKTDVQVRAIVQEIERVCEDEKIRIYHIEGEKSWTWVLIDCGDVIAHIFRDDERHYYALEELWKEAKQVELPKF